MTANTTRRAHLADAGAVAAVAAAGAPAIAQADPDAAFVALCHEFAENERAISLAYEPAETQEQVNAATLATATLEAREDALAELIHNSTIHTPAGIAALVLAIVSVDPEWMCDWDYGTLRKLVLTLYRETLRQHGLPVSATLAAEFAA